MEVNDSGRLTNNLDKEPNLNETIKSRAKSHFLYYWGMVGVLITILILDLNIYKYLSTIRGEKEIAFIQGSEQGIRKFILSDLKLIFNKSGDLNQMYILKNYSYLNQIPVKENIVGTVLYVSRENNVIMFDLQPLIFLVNSILAKDFQYQILLNNSILTTNSEDSAFFYINNYHIDEVNSLTIKLNAKLDAEFKQNFLANFQNQILMLIIGSSLLFLILGVVVSYLIYKKIILDKLNHRLLLLEKSWDLNITYIRECISLQEEKQSRDNLYLLKIGNNINITDIMEEIKIYTYMYTAKFGYKFELNLVSYIKNLSLNLNFIIFKQIIFSLLCNILYFMKDGMDTKHLSIEFHNDKFRIIYDSFAANETHMCRWSQGLSEYIGNPYILDCQKIFQLIKDCGLNYEIYPKQGRNEIVIILNKKESKGSVIKFYKNK